MTLSPPKTIRILSLDGGGMRGYFSAAFLDRFCAQAGITPNRLFASFDIITGTSIGGIQALAYAYGQTPRDLLSFFETKGAGIFSYSSVLPLSAYKFSVIMGLPTYPTTFYAQAPLQDALTDVFSATTKLSDLPGRVLIPSWNVHQDQPVLFSNITGFDAFLTGADQLAVDVGLATSAAPLYFPSLTLADEALIDGGVYCNNPVSLAYACAKKMYPAATRFCILSVGTGVAHNDFLPEMRLRAALHDPLVEAAEAELEKVRRKLLRKYPAHAEQVRLLTHPLTGIAPKNVDYLFYLMDNVFIPGPQELNAQIMEFEATDVYDDIFGYRFQYQFTEGQDAALDNYSPAQLTALAGYANAQYDINALNIQNFINHFNAGDA